MEKKDLDQIEQVSEGFSTDSEWVGSLLEQTRRKILSLDAETNWLWWQAFAIAAVVELPDWSKIEFVGRCPIWEKINPWVAENVLPKMEWIVENYSSYEELLKAFSEFYLVYKDQADIIVHVGVPVEAKLFIDAHTKWFIWDWDGPFPLIDISALPEIGISVDSYNKEHGIEVPSFEWGTHNPLYDSYAALEAYKHLLASRKSK